MTEKANPAFERRLLMYSTEGEDTPAKTVTLMGYLGNSSNYQKDPNSIFI